MERKALEIGSLRSSNPNVRRTVGFPTLRRFFAARPAYEHSFPASPCRPTPRSYRSPSLPSSCSRWSEKRGASLQRSRAYLTPSVTPLITPCGQRRLNFRLYRQPSEVVPSRCSGACAVRLIPLGQTIRHVASFAILRRATRRGPRK